jgi:hypothetical protein
MHAADGDLHMQLTQALLQWSCKQVQPAGRLLLLQLQLLLLLLLFMGLQVALW